MNDKVTQQDVLKQLKDMHEDVESLSSNLKALIAKIGGNAAPKEVSKTFDILEEVLGYGNTGLKKSEFHKIAKRIGYDPRGLAGFFKGKNKSLTYLPSHNGDEDRVYVTRRGQELLEEARG